MDQAMDQANDQDATAKDAVVQDRLKGQTIRTANLEIKDDGGAFVMDLISSQLPCRIEWNNNGRIVFNYKDTKYVIRK